MMTEAEKIKAMGEVIAEEIKAALGPLKEELAQLRLELKHATLQAKELRYAGVWNDRSTYKKGNFVTHHGSMWHANIDDVATMPGSDPTAWTMAIKRGADGAGARS